MFHKLAILDYYESLCRRVDIFTEEKNEKLEKCKVMSHKKFFYNKQIIFYVYSWFGIKY